MEAHTISVWIPVLITDLSALSNMAKLLNVDVPIQISCFYDRDPGVTSPKMDSLLFPPTFEWFCLKRFIPKTLGTLFTDRVEVFEVFAF